MGTYVLSFNGGRERERRRRGKVRGMEEGNRSYWVIIQLHLSSLRPCCHLTEQTSSLCSTDTDFVKGRLNEIWQFAVHVVCRVPGVISRKLHTSPSASKHKGRLAKQHLELFCSEDKTVSGNKKAHIHMHTKQSKAEHGTPIPSKQPLSTSLIPDVLYPSFYLFFIDFHNAFR